MTPHRIVVGAHYGWRDWLVQRISAVVMALYTVLILALLLWHGGLDQAAWMSTFRNEPFRLATFIVMVALLWHAWVGVRNILMDYVKPVGVASRAAGGGHHGARGLSWLDDPGPVGHPLTKEST